MSKIITAALAAAFLVLADGSASAQFANTNLKGSIQAHGFDLNDFGDTGELAALGLPTFTVMASSKVPSGFAPGCLFKLAHYQRGLFAHCELEADTGEGREPPTFLSRGNHPSSQEPP
jgi:hypothetical protein